MESGVFPRYAHQEGGRGGFRLPHGAIFSLPPVALARGVRIMDTEPEFEFGRPEFAPV